MKIRTKVAFSGVPQGTTGIAERDYEYDEVMYKVVWDLQRTKPLTDWFDEEEFKKYLEVIQV